MKYIKVKWMHSDPREASEPAWIYSEINDGREHRKVEIFPDGSFGFASRSDNRGTTSLATELLPPLSEIAANPAFEPFEITASEFKEIWRRSGGDPLSYDGPYTLGVGVISRNNVEAPFRIMTEPFCKDNLPWRMDELVNADITGGEFKSFPGTPVELLQRFLGSEMKGFSVYFGEPHAFLMLDPPLASQTKHTLWTLIAERDEDHPWDEAVLDKLIACPGVRYAYLSVHSVIEELDELPFVTKENFPWDNGLLLSARVRD